MKIIKLATAAFVCSALSACANTAQFQSELKKSVLACPPVSQIKGAGDDADAAVKSCEAERASGKLETYVDAAKCANPQIIKAFKGINYPYMDSVKTYTADHLAIARRMDNKEITKDQMQSLLKESVKNFVSDIKEAASIKAYPLPRKEAVESAECVTEGGRPIWAKYAPSFVDLYDAFREKIEKNAEAYAKGTISFNKYMADNKKDEVEFDRQVHSRRASINAKLMVAASMYAASMQAATSAYHPMPIQNVQPYTPTANVPAYVPVQDNYSQTIAPQPVGARGYNGAGSQPNTYYVPAGPEPNPPMNPVGNQTLGGN